MIENDNQLKVTRMFLEKFKALLEKLEGDDSDPILAQARRESAESFVTKLETEIAAYETREPTQNKYFILSADGVSNTLQADVLFRDPLDTSAMRKLQANGVRFPTLTIVGMRRYHLMVEGRSVDDALTSAGFEEGTITVK